MTIDLDLSIRLLRLVTPLAASLASVSVAIGLVTSHWLFSEEKMVNPKFNRTGDPELEYLSKFTVSGLWTLCYTNPGETERHCFNIDYFPTEEYSPDPNDSTLSIPYAVLRSSPFFLLATALLVVGEVSCIMGHIAPRRRFCTFLSGVVFILTGLLLLLGLVVYVSVFTAEIGSKLRPSSSLQPALFTYTYGYSFFLVVTGFLASEVAGTSAIFLFIYWHRNRIAKKEMHRKMALAVVQSPVDISQATHAHFHQQQQPVHARHRCEMNSVSNGFAVVPNSPCSCPIATISNNDDDCFIPTPPPAAIYPSRRHLPNHNDCPVHSDRNPYVTVHNPAVLPDTFRHTDSAGMMPDLTTFGRMMVHQRRRQMSADSDGSAFNKAIISGCSAPPSLLGVRHEQKICYQCHGAGHVTVPALPPDCGRQRTRSSKILSSSSLPRDLTITFDLESAEEDEPRESNAPHYQRSSRGVADQHQRRHSSDTTYHYGSLRRITAV